MSKLNCLWTVVILWLLADAQPVFSRPVPGTWPVPVKWPAAGTNSPAWHSVKVAPHSPLPKIHFYDKFNPVWWLENADEPVPPAWYLPGDKHRVLKWRFRNPFHNFGFYVIGVSDKHFVRSGHYPERNSNPHGGWDFEIARRRLALLPFVSYERKKFNFYFGWREHGANFYFGWREHGAFGVEMKFHKKTALKTKPPDKPPRPVRSVRADPSARRQKLT
ncbi:MAG: hypothetical protein ABSF34_11630 [Verrucomicrobiota bacterium]